MLPVSLNSFRQNRTLRCFQHLQDTDQGGGAVADSDEAWLDQAPLALASRN